jgi:hypothetical protein
MKFRLAFVTPTAPWNKIIMGEIEQLIKDKAINPYLGKTFSSLPKTE